MSRRTVAAGGREEYYRPARRTLPTRRSPSTRRPEESEAFEGDRNTLPKTIAIAILAVMAVVIAIDAQSVPALSLLAIVGLGAVIAAMAVYG